MESIPEDSGSEAEYTLVEVPIHRRLLKTFHQKLLKYFLFEKTGRQGTPFGRLDDSMLTFFFFLIEIQCKVVESAVDTMPRCAILLLLFRLVLHHLYTNNF